MERCVDAALTQAHGTRASHGRGRRRPAWRYYDWEWYVRRADVGTVVHPRCKIDATLAPIRLGDNCLVEEGAELVSTAAGMTIGDGNLFRAGCRVSSREIGNCNVFEPRCVVDAACIASFCTVGGGCQVRDAHLAERTVVYGAPAARRTWSGEGVAQRLALHAKHLQYLRDTLPHAHKLRLIR